MRELHAVVPTVSKLQYDSDSGCTCSYFIMYLKMCLHSFLLQISAIFSRSSAASSSHTATSELLLGHSLVQETIKVFFRLHSTLQYWWMAVGFTRCFVPLHTCVSMCVFCCAYHWFLYSHPTAGSPVPAELLSVRPGRCSCKSDKTLNSFAIWFGTWKSSSGTLLVLCTL